MFIDGFESEGAAGEAMHDAMIEAVASTEMICGGKRVLKKTANTWNSKQPFLNGCLDWMIPNLYLGTGCLTKHPL